MRRNLLFVMSPEEMEDGGLPYALNLAKITQKGIAVLMVYRKRLSERFEDLTTAATFAEANEHETAREIMKSPAFEAAPEKDLAGIREKCGESGIAANIYTASDDIPTALNELLKRDKSIDMVLFSPGITGNGKLTPRDFKKLLRTVSMPLVMLSRHDKSHSDKSREVA